MTKIAMVRTTGHRLTSRDPARAGVAVLLAVSLAGVGATSTLAQEADQPLAADITVDTYSTVDQMLLANELNESGEPFAEALGYDLDDLDPAVAGSPDDRAYALGIENYEYSRYELGTVVSRSGIGLHMMWVALEATAPRRASGERGPHPGRELLRQRC